MDGSRTRQQKTTTSIDSGSRKMEKEDTGSPGTTLVEDLNSIEMMWDEKLKMTGHWSLCRRCVTQCADAHG